MNLSKIFKIISDHTYKTAEWIVRCNTDGSYTSLIRANNQVIGLSKRYAKPQQAIDGLIDGLEDNEHGIE
jgi:hypothetical protein